MYCVCVGVCVGVGVCVCVRSSPPPFHINVEFKFTTRNSRVSIRENIIENTISTHLPFCVARSYPLTRVSSFFFFRKDIL